MSSDQALSDGKAPEAGKRRQGREMALQMLFQWEASGSHPSEVLRSFDLFLYRAETAGQRRVTVVEKPVDSREALTEPALAPPDQGSLNPDDQALANVERQVRQEVGAKAQSKAFQFAKELLLGVAEKQAELDQRISAGAENWRIERMPQVDRNILRIALVEFSQQDVLPKAVIIDEAIELAKKFGGDSSSSFVNGLLDGLLQP